MKNVHFIKSKLFEIPNKIDRKLADNVFVVAFHFLCKKKRTSKNSFLQKNASFKCTKSSWLFSISSYHSTRTFHHGAFSDAPHFSKTKLLNLRRDSGTSGSDFGVALHSTVRSPNTNHRLVHQCRREEIRQMPLFPRRGKGNANFLIVTTSASARIHKLNHNSLAPVRSVG